VVEDFPVVVVYDLNGGNLYRVGREWWRSETRKGESMSTETIETDYVCLVAIGRLGYVSGRDRPFR
jgi:tartrate dehydratase beta subunit/fumarate hydratase class I family protein